MSNYNLTLQTNNSSLEEIINQLNAMPDAGASNDPVLQAKMVTPTTEKQTVTADSGYDGLSKVEVNAMPTATQATPSITVSDVGLITASATQSAGYVEAGEKSATKQLSVQAAKTITPSKSSQTAVASGRYTAGDVTVAPIPDTYIQPSGTKTITENGTHDVSAYANATVNVPSEDLDAIITELETKVETLNTTLDGKAAGGGGGSIETCTVTVTGWEKRMYHSTLDSDGKIVSTEFWGDWTTTITCICGSMLTLAATEGTRIISITCNNCEVLRFLKDNYYAVIYITAGNGETATITVESVDD